jgi:predicted esterase
VLELLLLFVLFIALMLIMISPLEALSWWAGWIKDDDPHDVDSFSAVIEEEAAAEAEHEACGPDAPHQVRQYVIFLTGIGGYDPARFLPEERLFMDRLQDTLPEAHLVDDVYPYATTERALTEGQLFGWFWRFISRQKESRRLIGFMINLRNLMQVLVSADPRYGPIYSRGISHILLRALKRHDYPFDSGMPVTLIGYSGGGELAVSVIDVLHDTLHAPIRVISLGGVMGNDPAIRAADHVYHIYGSRDNVQRLGWILFPGRWPISRRSTWNQAYAEGRITLVRLEGFAHNGPGGYLDDERQCEDGRTLMDCTLDTVRDLLQANPHAHPTPDSA